MSATAEFRMLPDVAECPALAAILSSSLPIGFTTEALPHLCPDCNRPSSSELRECDVCERMVGGCCGETHVDGREFVCHVCINA